MKALSLIKIPGSGSGGSGGTNITLSTNGVTGPATLLGQALNIPNYSINLTTSGTTGPATLIGSDLNVPEYSFGTVPRVFNIVDYGAIGDGIRLTDGVATASSNVFTSASANFTSHDIGKSIKLVGAGASGHEYFTTIASVTNANTITLTVAPSTSVNPCLVVYGTDNTAAIQNTWLAADTAGGGTIWIPNGVFCVAGPLNTNFQGASPNAQICMPTVSFSAGTFNFRKHFIVQGEVKPNFSPISFNAANLISLKGSIIYSFITGSGIAPSVFGTQSSDNSNLNINYNYVTFKDLTIIVGQDVNNGGPTMGGINMWYSASCIVDSCMITTDGSIAASVLPTNEVAGIIVSRDSSEISSRLSYSLSVGFKYGYVGSDDVYYEFAQAWICDKAYVFPYNEEIAYASRLEPQWCRTWIYVPSAAILGGMVPGSTITTFFKIDYIGGELFSGSGHWYDYSNLLDDAGNAAHADVYYTTIQAGTAGSGNVLPFTYTGGSFVVLHEVGNGIWSNTSGQTKNPVTNINPLGQSEFLLSGDNSAAALGKRNSSATPYGALTADSGYLYTSGTGGAIIMADAHTTAPIVFASGGNLPKMTLFGTGNLAIGSTSDNGSLLQVNGTVGIVAPQTVVNGSISGIAGFSMPFGSTVNISYKKVLIFCNALNGTATYNFPIGFTNTPVVLNTNGLSASLVTSLTQFAVTVTGTTSTGFLIIEGY